MSGAPWKVEEERAVLGCRETAVFHGLPQTRLLSVEGADAGRFLQAMTTQDLSRLGPGGLAYAALADDRGRYVADFWVWRPGQDWWIECEAGIFEVLRERLSGFAVADDVEFQDRTGEFGLYHVEGPRILNVVQELVREGALPPGVSVGQSPIPGGETWLARRSRYGEMGLTLAASRNAAARLEAALSTNAAEAGAFPAGAQAREALRIEAGRPLGGIDVTGEDLLPEAGLRSAVSLDKGCYPGQEILQRVERQKKLRRRLIGLILESEPCEGPESGWRVTSASLSPRFGRVLALAWVPAAEAIPGREGIVRVDGGLFRGRVSELPFVRGPLHPLPELPTYWEETASTA
jgi:aminomethyltransferase